MSRKRNNGWSDRRRGDGSAHLRAASRPRRCGMDRLASLIVAAIVGSLLVGSMCTTKDHARQMLSGGQRIAKSSSAAAMQAHQVNQKNPSQLPPPAASPVASRTDGITSPFLEQRHRGRAPLTRRNFDTLRTLKQGPLTAAQTKQIHWDGKYDASDRNLVDTLWHLFPISHRAWHGRQALEDLLRFGPRAVGAQRDGILHYIANEGLGTNHYDSVTHRYRETEKDCGGAPHLSSKGRALLEGGFRGPHTAHIGRGEFEDPDTVRRHGWWWSLSWDNFTENVPIPLAHGRREGDFQNLVFHFRGGTQFIKKQQPLPQEKQRREGTTRDGSQPSQRLSPVKSDAGGNGRSPTPPPVYEQENFQRGLYLENDTSRPTILTDSGEAVHLKPSFGFGKASPLFQQPLHHVVLSAHWDTMQTPTGFLGACDSAVPVQYLLRTMKTMAVLMDTAEALTAVYESKAADGEISSADIPGVHTLFRCRPLAEVRQHLAEVLSRDHEALLFDYFFAEGTGYKVNREAKRRPRSPSNSTSVNDTSDHTRVVDVRTWLDWVQHLPAISVIFFDGEEAIKRWEHLDNTYGSRHLAQLWRSQLHSSAGKGGGRRQNRLESVDLFVLYDLMGTSDMSFHNTFPTQSGIVFNELAQMEAMRRQPSYATAVATTRAPRCIASSPDAMAVASRHVLQREWDAGLSRHVNPPASARSTTARATMPEKYPTPLAWQLFGSPHEMHTILYQTKRRRRSGLSSSVTSSQRSDNAEKSVMRKADLVKPLHKPSANLFFDLEQSYAHRRQPGTMAADDDHKHWLDTQRVLHLISMPFPSSWHTSQDDGSNIDDAASADLEKLLFDLVLMLGEYWETGVA